MRKSRFSAVSVWDAINARPTASRRCRCRSPEHRKIRHRRARVSAPIRPWGFYLFGSSRRRASIKLFAIPVAKNRHRAIYIVVLSRASEIATLYIIYFARGPQRDDIAWFDWLFSRNRTFYKCIKKNVRLFVLDHFTRTKRVQYIMLNERYDNRILYTLFKTRTSRVG